MVFVDVEKLDVFALMVVMMVESSFIDNGEVVVVREVSCSEVNPHNPFVRLDLVSPCLDNMRMIKSIMPLMMLHRFSNNHVEVVIESLINFDDLISHCDDLIKFNY